MLETVVMIIESLKGFEHKYSYAIVGHSGTQPSPCYLVCLKATFAHCSIVNQGMDQPFLS